MRSLGEWASLALAKIIEPPKRVPDRAFGDAAHVGNLNRVEALIEEAKSASGKEAHLSTPPR